MNVPHLQSAGQQILGGRSIYYPNGGGSPRQRQASKAQLFLDPSITEIKPESMKHLTEQECGYPMPQLYNQHYINKYAFPKGLNVYRRTTEPEKQKSRF